MQRLASFLHASQQSAISQRPKLSQNGPPVNPAGQGAPDFNSDKDATRSHLAVNEQFYVDDLSVQGSFASERIRLLRINPSEHLTPISCHFLTSSLQNHPDYDALSYCWGSQLTSQLCTITVDDRAGFYVTKHLLQALRRLRSKDRFRFVWVDAICINQSSLLERNHQVQAMRQIYSHAHTVVVWLGELDESQPSCERHLSAPDCDHDVCAEPGLSAVEHGNVATILREKLAADKQKSLLRSSFGEVYWKRIWVLQEFAASRSLPIVYLGPHAVRWQFFADVLWDKHDHPFSHLRSEKRNSLYGLLRTTYNSFYSTDPRDKIFALLGLAEQSEEICITPDYAKSIIEVHEETMYYLLRTEQTLDGNGVIFRLGCQIFLK